MPTNDYLRVASKPRTALANVIISASLMILFTAVSLSQTSVQLQSGTPGTQQTGHHNVSGSALSGGPSGVGTTAPHASAQLDVASTSRGLLPPRMTRAQMAAIGSPAAGLEVYLNNSSLNQHAFYDGARWLGLPSFFNVKIYGALADDATDSLSAIQGAVDAAEAAGGGLVYIPRGIYRVSGTIVNDTKGVIVAGDGPEATIIRTTSATANVFSLGNPASPYTPGGGVRDLSITSSVSRTSGYAVKVDGCEQGVLSNLRIATTGGGGLQFAPSNNSAAWFVHDISIYTTGAFRAISVEGGNDRYFSNLWLYGDLTTGSVGIYISKSGADFFRDIEVLRYEVGVWLDPPAGNTVNWLTFDNVLVDNSKQYGWFFYGSGSIYGISLVNCWSGSTATSLTSGHGFIIVNGNGIVLTGTRSINNGGDSLQIGTAVSNLEVNGGLFTGNSLASSGSFNGIAVWANNTGGLRFRGLRSGQAAGRGNTQGYGIYISGGCDNFIVSETDTRTNVGGGIANLSGTGPTRIVANNL